MAGERKTRRESETPLPSVRAPWKPHWPLSNKLNMILGNHINKWDFICYHYYQEFKWQYPYLLWRSAVLFCYAKVLEINCSIQQKLSFSLYSLYLERTPGTEKLSGNWTLLYEWKLLKKEIACNGLWLPPLPGCSEWVNQVKLQVYSQTPLSLIFPTWGKPVCHIQEWNFHMAEAWHWGHSSGARAILLPVMKARKKIASKLPG